MSVDYTTENLHCHQDIVRLVLIMESSLLGTLPSELVFRILAFRGPRDMCGLSCACQRTLWLPTDLKRHDSSLHSHDQACINFTSAHASYEGEVP